VSGRLERLGKDVYITVTSDVSKNITFVIDDMDPGRTYYMYLDTYDMRPKTFTADENGVGTITVDVSDKPYIIIINKEA
jgi:hypothetical protein